MELWYSEFHTGNVKLSVRINRQLFSGESEFQRIDVFESEEFGRFVALDGEIVFSDKDEFIYDEMVTHVPMTVHPNVKNVLIIGGGDGGVARELIHYPQIESIDVVESDKMFVDVCAEMFPDIAQGLKDERVNIYYEDGLRFLRNIPDEKSGRPTLRHRHAHGLQANGNFQSGCHQTALAWEKNCEWAQRRPARCIPHRPVPDGYRTRGSVPQCCRPVPHSPW